jgi:hypothetical protein
VGAAQLERGVAIVVEVRRRSERHRVVAGIAALAALPR